MARFSLPVVLGLAFGAVAAAAAPVNPADAPLRAVWFADVREGWAAGDHGIVWHTIDGGKTWERQPTGTKASLRAISFLTPYTGFAVGRTESPQPVGSHGVVLRTDDGGATWTELTSTTLPGLNAVRFFDEKSGIVVGDSTDALPAGAYTTNDGGKTWKPCDTRGTGHWTSLAFADANNGLVAGSGGRLVESKLGKFEAADAEPMGNATVRAMVRDGERAMAVGDAGLVRVRNAAAAKWTTPALPAAATAGMQFRAIAAVGDRVWAVGRPGSVVLHSPDFGKTWETQRIGHPVPLNAVHFADEKHGWAVGDLGTILATTDGGKTWAVQTCGGQRAAILTANAKPESAPFGAMAKLGAADGYLVVGMAGPGDEFRFAAAVRGSGGAVGETGPLSVANLVLAIRTWRPEIVVADALTGDRDALAAVQEAFRKAGDPTQFPEQIGHLGLKAHEPKKLVAPDADGAMAYDLSAFEAAFVDTPRDAAEPWAGLWTNGTVPAKLGFRLLSHRMPGAEDHKSLTDGISLPEGGTARRKKIESPVPAVLLAERETAAVRRRVIEAGAMADEKSLLQTATALRELPDDLAARAAVSIGKRFAETGQWTSAREMFALVSDRYPAQPDAATAFRWLVRFYGSSEVRRRIELGQMPVFQKAAFVPMGDSGVTQASFTEPAGPKPTYRFASADAAAQWSKAGLDLEPKLAAFGNGYVREPGTAFALLAARRNLGLFGDTTKVTKTLTMTGQPWCDAAHVETWLTAPTAGKSPKPIATALSAAKPHLDGKLDDACWQTAETLEIKGVADGTAAGYPTSAKFAWDAKFLYVAVVCGHPDGKQVPRAESRKYDDDLAGHDRVDLLLDLDRDYQTYYRFQIDHRGCVAEDCWGDKSWNPKWFVAVDPTATGWTAEIAIPRAELTGTPLDGRTPWAMNLVRVVPGHGTQAWSLPAGETPQPEGMGVLKFAK